MRNTDGFRRDAVCIALASGLSRPKVASDLGGGLWTLSKGGEKHQHHDLMSRPPEDVEKENESLGKEVRLLREERDVLKMGQHLLCRPKPPLVHVNKYCRAVGEVDPETWLTCVLARVADQKMTQLEDLIPGTGCRNKSTQFRPDGYDIPIHQWFLQSTPTAFSTGGQKPLGSRNKRPPKSVERPEHKREKLNCVVTLRRSTAKSIATQCASMTDLS